MSGFIKVDRAIFETDIMCHPVAFRLLMLIKKEAVYKNEGVTVNGVHVGRGQWLRSYRNLSKDLEYKEGRGFKKPGLATVKRAIKRLIEYGLVSISETDNGTLFTVAEAQENQAVEQSEEQNAEHLTERKRNVSGTLAEQDLRKKKEERYKKEDIYNTQQSEKVNPDFEKIENHYIQRRGLGLIPSPTDFQSIQSVLDANIPLSDILSGIDHAFDCYKPKHSRDRINSFKYCETVIFDLYEKKKARQKAQKRQGGQIYEQHSTRNLGEPFTTQSKPGKWDHLVIG